MVISFTGINNVTVKKKEYTNIGTYQNQSGSISKWVTHNCIIKISANVNDDENGNHLAELTRSFPKRYLDKDNPDKVELSIYRKLITNDEEDNIPLTVTTFKVNNEPLAINDYNKLAMMSFLAKFTRECSQNQEFSEEKRKYLRFANSQIAKSTMYAINTDLCSPNNTKY